MIPNSELIEWLKKKAETVTMPGARKMYQAAVKALEAQKYMVSQKTANVAICSACGKIDCDKMDKCEKLQLPPAQPERIKSKWALHTYMPHNKFCLACRNDSPYNKRWDFCPNCGAEMESEVRNES